MRSIRVIASLSIVSRGIVRGAITRSVRIILLVDGPLEGKKRRPSTPLSPTKCGSDDSQCKDHFGGRGEDMSMNTEARRTIEHLPMAIAIPILTPSLSRQCSSPKLYCRRSACARCIRHGEETHSSMKHSARATGNSETADTAANSQDDFISASDYTLSAQITSQLKSHSCRRT